MPTTRSRNRKVRVCLCFEDLLAKTREPLRFFLARAQKIRLNHQTLHHGAIDLLLCGAAQSDLG